MNIVRARLISLSNNDVNSFNPFPLLAKIKVRALDNFSASVGAVISAIVSVSPSPRSNS